MTDRRRLAEARAVELAARYETQVRKARLVNIEPGLDPRTLEFLETRGVACGKTPSADLISYASSGDRLIEVKGRGGRGTIEVVERQLDTMRRAGAVAWLYVAFGVTQPVPASLHLVREPGTLDWEMTQARTRTPDQARGIRHMAKFAYDLDTSDPRVEVADLSGLDLPSWAEARRD